MVLRLIFTDLRLDIWRWLGPLVVITAASAVTLFFVSAIATVVNLETPQSGVAQGILVLIFFNGASAIIVLNSVTNLSVAINDRAYALWQLAGIEPAAIRMIVTSQLLILSLVGSLAGCAIMSPLIQPLYDLFTSSKSLEVLAAKTAFGVDSIILVVVGIAVIVLVSGMRGARRAARIPAIEALREPTLPRARMGRLSSTIAIGSLALASILVNAMFSGANITLFALLLGPVIAAIFTSAAPLLFAKFVRAWTSLVPERMSAAWYLAKHAARFKVSQTTAAVSPLMIGVALTGSLSTVFATSGSAAPIEYVGLLLGAPLLLTTIGVAATIFLTSYSRDRELALIRASGSTDATIIAIAALEAIIHVVTAVLLGLVIVLAVGTTYAGAMSTHHPGVIPIFDLSSVGVVGIAGLVLVVMATVIPTAVALRHDVPNLLVAD